MSLVNIAGLMDELDATLKRCCESGCFHIEPAGNSPDSAMKPLSEKNEYDRPLKELAQLSAQLGITLKETDFTDCDLSAPQDFNSLFEKYNTPFSELNTKRLGTYPAHLRAWRSGQTNRPPERYAQRLSAAFLNEVCFRSYRKAACG